MWHMPQGVQCVRKSDGKRHPNCYPCNLKARQTNESAAANPTPAQVAGAQASLKKAQAVLLAVKVDYNVTEPVLPLGFSTAKINSVKLLI